MLDNIGDWNLVWLHIIVISELLLVPIKIDKTYYLLFNRYYTIYNMIRSQILRTVIKRNSRCAPSIVAIQTTNRKFVLSTTIASSKRAFSTAHHHDHDDGPPPMKNTFGGDFNWKDPLCIANSLTDDEVRIYILNRHAIDFILLFLTTIYASILLRWLSKKLQIHSVKMNSSP